MRAFFRLAAFLLPVFLAWPASAQNYPNRPVKLIVPFGAGGPADVYARVLAQHLVEDQFGALLDHRQRQAVDRLR